MNDEVKIKEPVPKGNVLGTSSFTMLFYRHIEFLVFKIILPVILRNLTDDLAGVAGGDDIVGDVF